MKIVIQRVKSAKVSVVATNEVVGQIEKGLFVLFGIKEGDTSQMARELATKLIKLRIMSDQKDKMNLSVKDTDVSILVISQFTLYADTSGGNRPSFVKAAKPDDAKPIYEAFIKHLKELEVNVQTGSFGNYMNIDAELDGPVTIILEN